MEKRLSDSIENINSRKKQRLNDLQSRHKSGFGTGLDSVRLKLLFIGHVSASKLLILFHLKQGALPMAKQKNKANEIDDGLMELAFAAQPEYIHISPLPSTVSFNFISRYIFSSDTFNRKSFILFLFWHLRSAVSAQIPETNDFACNCSEDGILFRIINSYYLFIC